MNRLIVANARRGTRTVGLVDRLRGTPPLDVDRQERLNLAMADYEHALKRGDDIAAQIADEKVDALLNESRAARQEPQPPAPSFDGGARRSVSTRPPPNMNGLIARSLAERRALAAAVRGD
jgi:hypothetical protein